MSKKKNKKHLYFNQQQQMLSDAAVKTLGVKESHLIKSVYFGWLKETMEAGVKKIEAEASEKAEKANEQQGENSEPAKTSDDAQQSDDTPSS